MKLLLVFIVLNIVNVMLQTFKTLSTVNGGKWYAAIMNAVAYGFYTVVVIYMLCDLPTLVKALVVGLCNLVGVYVVKDIEERRTKDKLWKIEFAVKNCCVNAIEEQLKLEDIPYNLVVMPKEYVTFNAFCQTRAESDKIKVIINQYGAKYCVTESKSLV